MIISFGTCAILVGILLWKWWFTCKGSLAFDSSIPSLPGGSFLLGHLKVVEPMYGEEGVKYYTKWGRVHARIMKMRFVFYYFLSTAHPDYVRDILRFKPEKGFMYDLTRDWIGDGILFSTKEKWSVRRKLLTPIFHFGALEAYTGSINKSTNTFVDEIYKYGGYPIDLFQKSINLAMDTVLKCLLGYESNCQIAKNEYAELMSTLAEISVDRLYSALQIFDWYFFRTKLGKEYLVQRARFWEIGYKLIEQRRYMHENNPHVLEDSKEDTFLDTLLKLKYEDGTTLTTADIQEELNTFMYAGHDTTACAISWSIYFLSLYPDHQTRCRDEVRKIMGDSGGFITQEQIKSMSLLGMFIKEVLRLRPSVPYIARKTDCDIKVGEHFIPNGTTLVILVNSLHRLHEFWDDPDEFKPDRFTPAKSKNRHPFCYIPFGAGNRNCIGKNLALVEIKMAVAKILYNFEIKTIDPQSVTRRNAIVLRPVNLFVEFEPIDI